MARRIFSWFSPRRGKKVLRMVEKHLGLTMNAVTALCNLVEASAKSLKKDCASILQSIDSLEMEADQLRRDMIEELTRSEMFPEEREDLMELVRAVDWIADWSKEAGRILAIIPFDKAPEEMKQAAQNMCKVNQECVKVLINCINSLGTDPKKAISLANEVELFEEDIDGLYQIAREHLATLEFPHFTRGALILLNEFLDALETIADWCENTADIVRAVAVRI